MDGVSYYVTGVLTLSVPFANGKITCQNCIYCQWEHGLSRAVCPFSRDIILNPAKEVGQNCPIKFDERISEIPT